MIRETVRDMTATGPMETSFEVANSYGEVVNMDCVSDLAVETYTVDEHAHKGGVEAVLSGQCCDLLPTCAYTSVLPRCWKLRTHLGVRHALRHYHDTDRQAGDDVAIQPPEVWECCQEWAAERRTARTYCTG